MISCTAFLLVLSVSSVIVYMCICIFIFFWSRVSGVTTLRRPCGIEYCDCVCFMLILMSCSFACKYMNMNNNIIFSNKTEDVCDQISLFMCLWAMRISYIFRLADHRTGSKWLTLYRHPNHWKTRYFLQILDCEWDISNFFVDGFRWSFLEPIAVGTKSDFLEWSWAIFWQLMVVLL